MGTAELAAGSGSMGAIMVEVYKRDGMIQLVYDGIVEGGIGRGDQCQSDDDGDGRVNETLTASL